MAPELHPQGHATRPAAHRGPVAAALLATLFFSCGGGSGGGYQPPPGPSQEGEEGPNGPSPLEVPGTTYYANAVTGDDHNHGLTASSPLRTLAAAANKLSPAGGDRLCLQGTFQESLFLSGINNPVIGDPNPALPTVIQCAFDAAGKALPAAIDGGISGAASFPFDKQGLPPGFGPGTGDYLWVGVDLSDCNYVSLSGFEVRGIAGMGIQTRGSSHLLVEHMTTEWTSLSAMSFGSQAAGPMVEDLTVAHNRINQSNLGLWNNAALSQGFSMVTETVSIANMNGFEVFRNHVSNSMMVGIDIKERTNNGSVRNNLVENLRSIGIYANEATDARIYQNIIRRIGYYDPEDGSGVQFAGPYLSQKLPFTVEADAATGVLVANGDLGAAPETGRCSRIRVYENIVSWTLKNGISVNNEWRYEGKSGWEMDEIHIYNNVIHRSAQSSGAGGVVLDIGMTNSTVVNNIIDSSRQYGVFIIGTGNFFTSNAISNNLYNLNAMYGVLGMNARHGDPLFLQRPPVVLSSFDFRLDHGSPGINAGVLDSSGVDIGAYQSNGVNWTAGPRTGN